MSAKVDIVDMQPSMASYVAANLRDRDVTEFRSVFGQHDQMADIVSNIAVMSGQTARAAMVNGEPVLIFGTLVFADIPHLGSAWGYGTDRAWRAIPEVGRYIKQDYIPKLLSEGMRRVEVRVLASNRSSVSWLALHMGAEFDGPLQDFGRDGELFLQYSWTKRQFENV